MPIESFEGGSKTVWGYDDEKKRPCLQWAHLVTKREVDRLCRITTTFGRVVETTADHPFYVDREYKPASMLVPGDRLLCAQFGKIEIGSNCIVSSLMPHLSLLLLLLPSSTDVVASVEHIRGQSVVYNLQAENTANFFAGGILVHNCDDPVKNMEEAESPVYQRRLQEWFKTTLYTRLAPGGAVILVATRWHEQDLPGRLLDEAAATGIRWEVIKFPAIAEEDDILGRKRGDALWPWRYDLAALEKIRATIGGRFWNGLYQADPEGDIEGTLWRRETMIDPYRVVEAPELVESLLAIDPAGGSAASSDEVGMVGMGRGEDGRGYVLFDVSGRYAASPNAWAQEAIKTCIEYGLNRIVAEKNFGGNMVLAVIQETTVLIDGHKYSGRQFISERDLVTASSGKHIRAEPIANLYEQGHISHVGELRELEHELSTWVAKGPGRSQWSPNRLDALVWAASELMLNKTGDIHERLQMYVGAGRRP